jgi:uncharacterized protein
MKFVRVLFVLLFAAVTAASAEKAMSVPAPTAYVDDYADVLSTGSKARIEAICREVHDKTQAQLFVVTMQSLDGEAVADFANDLFHHWGIGDKKTDRGILLLLAPTEH